MEQQDGKTGDSSRDSQATPIRTSGSSPSENGSAAHFNKQSSLPRPIRYGGSDSLDSPKLQEPVPRDTDQSKPLGFFSFRSQPQTKLEWLIEGLLYRGVTGMTGAFAKTGKTQVTMRMLTAMLTQEKFLHWTIHPRAKQEKILFLSLEMNSMELGAMLETMTDLDLTQHGAIEEQLLIECSLSRDWQNKKVQEQVLERVAATGATGLVVDALGSIMGGSINDDVSVRETFDFLAEIKDRLGVWVWLVHHTRKRTTEGKPHPPTIDDLYGSQYISGRIRSSLALFKANDDGLLLVSTPAVTLAKEVEPFYIQRTDELDFKLVDGPNKWQPRIKLVEKTEDGFFEF